MKPKPVFKHSLAVALALLFSASVHSHSDHPKTQPSQADEITPQAKPTSRSRWGHDYFPNTVLIDHNGKPHRFYDDLIKGKVVAINFIFTSCEYSCPVETARMRKVQQLLGDRVGDDIHLYSISIDPENDTPEVLNAYRKKFKGKEGWSFFSGNKDEIIELRKKLGLYISDIQNNPDNPNDHNLSLVIGNEATGRWMKRSPFENPQVLATQLRDWLHNWKQPATNKDSYANAPQLRNISRGEELFRGRCQSCHSIGDGDGLGPDLLGVTRNRDRQWLTRWLKEPDKMLAEGDPIAVGLFKRFDELPMPNLQLNRVEIVEILSFLSSEDQRILDQGGQPDPVIASRDDDSGHGRGRGRGRGKGRGRGRGGRDDDEHDDDHEHHGRHH